MYGVIAAILAAGFAVAMVAVPFRVPRVQSFVTSRLRSAVLLTANRAWFQNDAESERTTVLCARAWFLVTAVLFVALGVEHGELFRNDPDSIAVVAAYGVSSFALSGVLLFSVLAYARFLPEFRASATLGRCGFRGLWVLERPKLPARLPEDIEDRVRSASAIDILDVTAFELFVKGKGGREPLLTRVLQEAHDVPVRLLLLNPMAKAVDPDCRQATVFQSTLREMQLQSGSYMKRLRSTLGVVDQLNRSRGPEAQIDVRYYDEKPAMRTIAFDDAMIVSPWEARSERTSVPFLEVLRESASPSFYETFRRQFSRLWLQGIAQVFAG